MTSRNFDLIIFGASGYTGQLVAEYIQKAYGRSTLRWAIAGRSEDKLKTVRRNIGAQDSLPILIADVNDAASIDNLAQQASVIITTVGPYQLYGTVMVEACSRRGTDYVDLCGEPAWMHDTVRQFQKLAEQSGARIVHSCGFDSIPFDMGVYYTQMHALSLWGETCSVIRGRVRKMQGKFSGGTAASFVATMARAGKDPRILDWLKDPFTLVPAFTGPAQPPGHKPLFEKDINSWAAPFIMASINTKNVHRSNAMLGFPYGEDFTYDEMILTGPGQKGEEMSKMVIAQNGRMGVNPPKPGEGPTKEERENGCYDVLFLGKTKSGKEIATSVSANLDPGYGSTSKMLSEAALCLLRDVSASHCSGGIYTPAAAMKQSLITRLEKKSGLTFKLEHQTGKG